MTVLANGLPDGLYLPENPASRVMPMLVSV